MGVAYELLTLLDQPYDAALTAEDEELLEGVSVAVTGHIVVEMAIVDVTMLVESAGQLVMVGAHEVMVISVVENTVLVV